MSHLLFLTLPWIRMYVSYMSGIFDFTGTHHLHPPNFTFILIWFSCSYPNTVVLVLTFAHDYIFLISPPLFHTICNIGTQMVLTMKLTSFAYNLYDGTADKKKVFAVHEDKKQAKIYADRKWVFVFCFVYFDWFVRDNCVREWYSERRGWIMNEWGFKGG